MRAVSAECIPSSTRVALARATELLSTVEAEIVPGAGHALPLSHADHAIARIADFVARRELT